jgi:hypothetical protein
MGLEQSGLGGACRDDGMRRPTRLAAHPLAPAPPRLGRAFLAAWIVLGSRSLPAPPPRGRRRRGGRHRPKFRDAMWAADPKNFDQLTARQPSTKPGQ